MKEASNPLEMELFKLNKNIDKRTLNKCIYQMNEIERINEEYNITELNSLMNEYYKIKEKLNDPENQLKLISLMNFANKLVFGYYARNTQLISLLFFINKPNNEGLIQQVMTGEGKSLIISFLAVFINLVHKKKVDILTSSIILAQRDCLLYKNFYKLFDVKTDFCRDNLDSEKKNKICYDTDILYGDCLNFEADILKANFLGAPGRKLERGFECIIIDEIDNICIDNIKNITELLDDFPGYKSLEYIYIYIYSLLLKIDLEYNKNDLLINIDKEKIIHRLTNEFEDFLNQNKKEELIFYPTFLHDYILLRKKEWCRNAFEAKYEFKKNKQYIISKDESGNQVIKPIDYFNTGIIQQNSVWPGLHQFLELKEGLNLTAENLNSCYMSNLTFFKKYNNSKGNNIFGLTGTLGSKETQLALKEIYKMNFVLIPTYKPSLLEPPEYFVLDDNKEYEQKIIEEIIKYSEKRAVLVIFEYIDNIKEIRKKLFREDSIDSNKIIVYKDSENNNESSFLKNSIQIGNIILATNLAARGTDIRISKELERNGGLHVILTYLPCSERVERQALGRAGRKGEKGSGEIIINSSHTLESLIKDRDEREKNLYDKLMNEFSVRDGLYEKLFDKFCSLLLKIRKTDNLTKDYFILDLKEKWGFFLIKNNINNVNGRHNRLEEVIEKNYSKFENEISNYFCGNIKDYKFRNPLIESNNINLDSLQRIVEECRIYSIGANYFIIYLYIKTQNPIEELMNYLDKLEDRLENFINFSNTYLKNNIMNVLKYEKSQYRDILSQNDEKLELFNILKNNIEEMKTQINIKKEYPNVILKVEQKTLIKDLYKSNRSKFSKDTIKYFSDLGIYFLYDVSYDKNRCCPM